MKRPCAMVSSKFYGLRTPPEALDLAGFFGEHDGDAVADRVGQTCGLGDKLLRGFVEGQAGLAHWADQYLEQKCVRFSGMG